jgi:serine/threonine protein kinase
MNIDPLIGQQLGDYTIVSMLGRGGMARVYKGFDARLERYAAVKVIDSQLVNSGDAEEYRQRFHREARSIARLRHPNIVNVYQFGEYGNLYYMAMMFIEGRDLGNILREHAQQRTRMSYGATMRIARDMAAALDYAHREGVIHRDIKPSNIMVMADGHAILTDFGLALSVPEGSIGNTFGSAHYIAPEQAKASNNAVPQSDLYSLGVVLYQMLAGRVPFDDPSAMSVAIQHLQDPPPNPSQFNPELSGGTEAVLLKGLHKKVEGRYPNGAALILALESALNASGRNLLYTPSPQPIVTVVERVERASNELPSSATMMLPPENTTMREQTPPQIKKLASAPSKPIIEVPEVAPFSQPIPLAPRKRTPLPFVIAGAVIIVLAFIVWGLIQSSVPAGEIPSATMVAQSNSATFAPLIVASEQPSVTSTRRPTQALSETPAPSETAAPSETPTPRPSATERPTAVPPEPSLVPTNVPATAVVLVPTLSDTEAQLRLEYDSISLLLVNISSRSLDLAEVEFVQSLADGSHRTYRASQWSSSRFSVMALRPRDCVQIWTDSFVLIDPPTDCTRQSWRAVSRPRWFWLSNRADATFEVYLDGELLTTCLVAAGSCEFVLREE